MSKLQPYRTWSRKQLYRHSILVLNMYVSQDSKDYVEICNQLNIACHSIFWNPLLEYNGCTVVQDPHHPFPPCLIHDYDCIVEGWTKDNDLKFQRHCELFGMNESKAKRWFRGVRIGRIYYKYFK